LSEIRVIWPGSAAPGDEMGTAPVREREVRTVNHTGPATNGNHLQNAVEHVYAVKHFLEVPYQLTDRDWQEACDGLEHVVIAAQQLAAVLTARCAVPGRADDLGAVHDLLHQAAAILTPTDPV
jgi:hypothetical protein